jgi:alkylation response protein AidB-like acyl-CoA dehydrogenase
MRRPMTSEEDTFWGGRNTKFSSEPQRVWFERMRDKGWTVPHWPSEYGGGGLDPEQTKIVRQEMAAIGARQPLTSFGISMLGPALAEIRHRCAEERTSAEDRSRFDPLVPGLFRAERRIGPRFAADPRRERWRRLCHQRPEDLDFLCQLRRLDFLPGADRSGGEEA